jgi:hypothetical protein
MRGKFHLRNILAGLAIFLAGCFILYATYRWPLAGRLLGALFAVCMTFLALFVALDKE